MLTQDLDSYVPGFDSLAHKDFYKTLPSKLFSLVRAFAYVARCLAFVACGLVVASSFFKIVDMQTIQTRLNVTQIIAIQRSVLCTRKSDERFVKAVQGIAAFYTCALLNVSHIILQSFTIIVRFISFNLPCFATDIYIPCINISFQTNTFSYAFISVTVTIQIKIYWSHNYFLASGCAPIVKGR